MRPETRDRLFRAASAVFPANRTRALLAVKRASIKTKKLLKNQRRLSERSNPYRSRQNEEECRLEGLFAALHELELEEEANGGAPSTDDYLVRYIKHLLWRTVPRSERHVVVGMGIFLYDYSLAKAGSLLPDGEKDNDKKLKRVILNELASRFPKLDRCRRSNGQENFRRRGPKDDERRIVDESLRVFAPMSPHVGPDPTAWKKPQEWLHALVDPKCFGFAQVVKYWNENKKDGKRYEPAEETLQVPDFGDLPPDPSSGSPESPPRRSPNRFKAAPLTDDEHELIGGYLREHEARSTRFSGHVLRVRVDGKDHHTFDARDGLPLLRFSPNTLYVDVYGEDTDGELLLATFSGHDLKEMGEQGQPLWIQLGPEREVEIPFALDGRLARVPASTRWTPRRRVFALAAVVLITSMLWTVLWNADREDLLKRIDELRTELKALRTPAAFRVYVTRDGERLTLEDALPLQDKDLFQLEADLPSGYAAAMFLFDSEGNLTELGTASTRVSSATVSLRYPPDRGMAVPVEGPEGNEVFLVCARKSDKPDRNELDGLFSEDDWPRVPKDVALELQPGGVIARSNRRGPSTDLESVNARLDALTSELRRRFDFVSGIVLPHVGKKGE